MGRFIKVKGAALVCSIALSLAQQITGAAAFSPEPVAPPSTNKPAAPATPFGTQLALPGQPPQTQLNDPLSQVGKDKGTELKIPGIGSVGAFPKLDFGLELLYGPKNGPDALQLDQHGQEDLQIKGTLTHKF
jgi:hypothetical protein